MKVNEADILNGLNVGNAKTVLDNSNNSPLGNLLVKLNQAIIDDLQQSIQELSQIFKLEKKLKTLERKLKFSIDARKMASLSNQIQKLKLILIEKIKEKIEELEEKRLEQYKKFKELEMNKKDGPEAKLAQKAIEMEKSELEAKLEALNKK